MANIHSEKLKAQLERIKLDGGVNMESTDDEVSVEHEENNEMAEYRFENADDFAEGVMFVLDLIQNGYMRVRA